MKDITYDHRNWRKLIFKDGNSEYQDEVYDADDNEMDDAVNKAKSKVVAHGTEPDDKYKPKSYDFHQYRKTEYKELMKKVDEQQQKSNHSFLDQLKSTEDRQPNFKSLPQSFYLIEKMSNVKGRFLNSQDSSEPIPYIEIGDLAQRLVYQDKSLITHGELEVIDVKPLGREVGPVESLELCRILLGIQTTMGSFKDNKVEHILMSKLLKSVCLCVTV